VVVGIYVLAEINVAGCCMRKGYFWVFDRAYFVVVYDVAFEGDFLWHPLGIYSCVDYCNS